MTKRAQGEFQRTSALIVLVFMVALVTASTLTATPKPSPSASHPPTRLPTNSPTRLPPPSQSPYPSRNAATPSPSSSSEPPSSTPSTNPTSSRTTDPSPSQTSSPVPSPSRSTPPSASSSPKPPENDITFKTCNVTNFHGTVNPGSYLVFCCPLTYNINGDSGNVTASFYQILSQEMLPYQSLVSTSGYCQIPSTPVGQYDDNYVYSVDAAFGNPGYVSYYVLFGFYNPNYYPLKLEILFYSVASHL